MKIAFIIPSLANKGPVLVVQDLIANLNPALVKYVKVFYFDDILEVPFLVPIQKLSFNSEHNFDGFDVVHSHGLRPDLFIFRNKSRIKAKCISTMHNMIFEQYRSIYNIFIAFLIQTIWIFALKRHDAIVCLTKYMQTYYVKLFTKGPVYIVYNGRTINSTLLIEEDDLRLIQGFKNDLKILGSACIVSKLKGLHQIINALPEMIGYGFILVGDGPELENLKKLATELKVYDRCLFLGQKQNAYKFYSYFDIFVMASYTEGVPLALLEAAALKVPAICSNIDVLREIFNSEQVAFFNLDNINEFKTAATLVMEDHLGFSDKIYERYQSNYTSRKMAQNYEFIYNKLILSEPEGLDGHNEWPEPL